MKSLIPLLLLTLFMSLFWGCGDDDDEEETTTPPTTQPSPPPTPAAMLVLANNTGIDANSEQKDAFTTDGRVTITAEGGAEITLTVTKNGEEIVLDPPPDPITMAMAPEGSEETTTEMTIDIETRYSIEAPVGDETIAVVVTAEAMQSNKQATRSTLNFTLVTAIRASDVTGVTLALEEDTGDADMITTDARVSATGTIPDNVELSFAVTTNGSSHSHSITGTGTKDFSIAPPTSGTMSVSVSYVFTRHGHSATNGTAFAFTLFAWPASVMVSYTDNGADPSDGVTTESELTVSGFSGIDGTNIKLSSYTITNTGTMMADDPVDLAGDDQVALSATYTLDMRDAKPSLGANERVYNVRFLHTNGHDVTYVFEPGLRYVVAFFSDITFARKFDTADDPFGIAITSGNILLVTSTNTDKVHFYDTDGNDATIDSVSSFGGNGNQTNQFNDPQGIAVDNDGNIYVADYRNNRVQIFEDDFDYSTNITGLSFASSLFIHDDTLYVSAQAPALFSIRTFALDDRQEGSNISGSVDYYAVAIDSNDVYHLINRAFDRVEAWTGDPTDGFTNRNHRYNMRPGNGGSGTSNPYDLVVGPTTGWLYVSDSTRHQVLVLEYDGDATTNQYTLVGTLGKDNRSSGAGDGEFDNPLRMLIHDGQLYVVDQGNDRIQVFDVAE